MGRRVSDSKSDIAERLFAWSFRLAVAAGLRRGDLLNAGPATLVLLKEGLVGLASKTKKRGKSEGRNRGASNFAFPNKNRLESGFRLFGGKSGGFSRAFWIWGPLFMESGLGICNQAPALGLEIIKRWICC